MNLNPTILKVSEKKVIGMQSAVKGHEQIAIMALWKRFMPRKRELQYTADNSLIAIQIYADDFVAENSFDIWACAEVSDFIAIPTGMKAYTIPSGSYAVFHYKGSDASNLYSYIMTEWLPTSNYQIDDRPHFQVMGAAYKNGSPNSEEDFYVPVRLN